MSEPIREARWVDTVASRRSSRHSEDRAPQRLRIVLGAIEAIEAYGVDPGTARIAEHAGVARPHVYRYFDGKDELVDEVASYAAGQLVGLVRPTLRLTGTPLELVRGPIAAAVAWAEANPNLYRFLAARQQTRTLHRERLGRPRLLGEIVDAATAYLRSREPAHDVPDGILAGLVGMVDSSTIWWLDHRDEPGSEDQEALTERLTRQVWLILADMLAQLGIVIPDGAVLTIAGADTPS